MREGVRDGGIKRQGRCAAKGRPRHAGRGRQRQRPRGEAARSQRQRSTKAAKKLCLVLRSLQMCVHKISGFVTFRLLTCSSFLRSQIFYASANGAPVMPNVPIVRGSGVSEQGVPLFAGLSASCVAGGGGSSRTASISSRAPAAFVMGRISGSSRAGAAWLETINGSPAALAV